VVAACGILCCGFSSSWPGVELRVMRPVCRMLVYFLLSSLILQVCVTVDTKELTSVKATPSALNTIYITL